jgi:hypothetical protein
LCEGYVERWQVRFQREQAVCLSLLKEESELLREKFERNQSNDVRCWVLFHAEQRYRVSDFGGQELQSRRRSTHRGRISAPSGRKCGANLRWYLPRGRRDVTQSRIDRVKSPGYRAASDADREKQTHE